jgi:two-component system cell cycle response regulator
MSESIIKDSDDRRMLQRQLRVLLDHARLNEDKLQRMQALELRLLGCGELHELIDMLLNDYVEEFDLDASSLLLVDPEYEIRRILDEHYTQIPRQLRFDTESVQHSSDQLFPMLGPWHSTQHARYFGKRKDLSSVAILPLLRQGRYLGSLNLGSNTAGRYIDGAGTVLLEHLAAIVAVCLENSLNYERLKRTGLTDGLTGINNRRFFDQRITEEVERSRRNDEALSCLFIDIDFFKRINDTWGHQQGDIVLRDLASLLQTQLRRSDVLARYGGEEFSMLLANSDCQEGMDIAERLRKSVAACDFGSLPEITVSIGVATIRPAELPGSITAQANGLLKAADEALYVAKQQGRNRVSCARGTLDA